MNTVHVIAVGIRDWIPMIFYGTTILIFSIAYYEWHNCVTKDANYRLAPFKVSFAFPQEVTLGIFDGFVRFVTSPLETLRLLDAITGNLKTIDDRLVGIAAQLRVAATKDIDMSVALDKLTAEVAENKDAVASASALLSTLAQEIRDNAGDQEALEALAASLDAQNAELSAAVTANTPADPEFDPSANG